MRRFRRLLLFLLLLLLASCAPVSSPPIDFEAWRLEAEALPGADVTGVGEPLTISYPDERLFGHRAALPFPGGLEILEPLATFLQTHSGKGWQARVRADTDQGEEHNRLLAAKRAELLQPVPQQRCLQRSPVQAVVEESFGFFRVRPDCGTAVHD